MTDNLICLVNLKSSSHAIACRGFPERFWCERSSLADGWLLWLLTWCQSPALAIEVFCCHSCSHLFTLPAAPLWSWRFLKVPMGSWVLLEVHTMNFIEISDHWQISKNQRCLFLFSDLPAEQQNEWSSLIAPCLHTWTLDRQIYFSVCSSGRSFRRSSSQVMKTRSNSVI